MEAGNDRSCASLESRTTGVDFDSQTLTNELIRALVSDQLIQGPPPSEPTPAAESPRA